MTGLSPKPNFGNSRLGTSNCSHERTMLTSSRCKAPAFSTDSAPVISRKQCQRQGSLSALFAKKTMSSFPGCTTSLWFQRQNSFACTTEVVLTYCQWFLLSTGWEQSLWRIAFVPWLFVDLYSCTCLLWTKPKWRTGSMICICWSTYWSDGQRSCWLYRNLQRNSRQSLSGHFSFHSRGEWAQTASVDLTFSLIWKLINSVIVDSW